MRGCLPSNWKDMDWNRTASRGFTLVELLVVMVIVGMIAALLLPALAKSRANALRIKCVHNLGGHARTLIGFADDNQGRLPWRLTPRLQQLHFGNVKKNGLCHSRRI